MPRLRRDDRRFLPLPIVRPERAVLTGERGLANAIHQLRTGLGLSRPMLGEIKNACHPEQVEKLRGWLEEARQLARDRLLDVAAEQPAPTLVLPVDQAEELFHADAGPEAPLGNPFRGVAEEPPEELLAEELLERCPALHAAAPAAARARHGVDV